jgi:TPR repeat protein
VDAFHRSFPIISTVSKSVIIKSMLIFFHSIILLDIAVGSRFAKHDRLPRSQNTCQLQRGLEKYPTPLEGMAHMAYLASNGDALAQAYLGTAYCEGDGISKDISEGIQLLEASSKQGNDWAQQSLGALYASGLLVGKDEVEAIRLFRLAANKGNQDSY